MRCFALPELHLKGQINLFYIIVQTQVRAGASAGAGATPFFHGSGASQKELLRLHNTAQNRGLVDSDFQQPSAVAGRSRVGQRWGVSVSDTPHPSSSLDLAEGMGLPRVKRRPREFVKRNCLPSEKGCGHSKSCLKG